MCAVLCDMRCSNITCMGWCSYIKTYPHFFLLFNVIVINDIIMYTYIYQQHYFIPGATTWKWCEFEYRCTVWYIVMISITIDCSMVSLMKFNRRLLKYRSPLLRDLLVGAGLGLGQGGKVWKCNGYNNVCQICTFSINVCYNCTTDCVDAACTNTMLF